VVIEMPLKKGYGVLKGKVFDKKMGTSSNPHYEVHIKGDKEIDYRTAINIASKEEPSEVLYFVSEDFKSQNITILPTLEYGYTRITKENQNIALDYIRGGLFNPQKMIPLPAEIKGENNDLNEKIQHYIGQAQEKDAVVYAFGERCGPDSEKDKYFHFSPVNTKQFK
jgi:uncharacterized protein YukJ